MSTRVHEYFNIKFTNLTCVQPDGKNEIEISKLNSKTYKCLEHKYFKTENNCQNNCTCYIRPADKIRILDCSYKNMSKFLINETGVIFMRNNPIILNLTGNFLTEIPSIETFNPINVTSLLLSNNKISSITFDKLPYSLKVLELHNNYISKISLDELNYLKSIDWKKFTLSGNPIICDCDNVGLFNFVKLNRHYYKDLNNLTCENTDFPMYELTTAYFCSLCQLHFILCLGLTMIIALLVIVIFFNRKKIKSCLFTRI
ncbi:PREDICTED: protein toll-like [Polistes canadensis]|uniref:protein toll-like n=1 Tax=Polistes canadensis TaxID=91411 RepID=UPI000718D82A|nr:PREDICTED: protein toll-like [Polistes canadensis]